VRVTGAEVTAVQLSPPAARLPTKEDWSRTVPVSFAHDWRGQNANPERKTEVRLLWNDELLFVGFQCRYRSLTVFPDASPNRRRNQLWERDVAEIFLQPDRFGQKYYREFEISPNGRWLDLDISPKGLTHINSGMRSRTNIYARRRIWTAELAIPFGALTTRFDPGASWRVNFFRCEGSEPERFYSAWQPTETERPNFHVPEKFGILRFQP